MNINICGHIRRFDAYYRQFKQKLRNDCDSCEHLYLKWEHSLKVLENAEEILTRSDFPRNLARAALLAALYHDVARFEQYSQFHTFRDGLSFNHGARGSQILKRECLLLDGECKIDRALVRAAVSMHNRAGLPAHLPRKYAVVTGLVRDADKIDILRVLAPHMRRGVERSEAVTAHLPEIEGQWSEKIFADLLSGRCARYEDLRCLNDFRLLVCSWLFSLNYPCGLEIIRRQGHIFEILEGLPNVPEMDKVRSIVHRTLA
ncbi:MAG: HD domain-containing protein [Desulfovibrionaceae bacterium]|nr:HD domain-containing protein [Desulfovibrionaceae bacterium]